ncbi:MAG: alpha/beta fold hydrolase, partial [Chromatiaceae bacterium]
MAEIETGTVMVDGVSTFFRRVPGDGPPAVFVHGNPTHSEDWLPFLERMRRPALAFDLPGWGRSARPSPAAFDYSMDGLGHFVGRFLQRLAVDDHSLVVHDWGSVALLPAQEEPAGIRRLVIINAVPLLPGYRWHRTARIWRTRGLGELSTRL